MSCERCATDRGHGRCDGDLNHVKGRPLSCWGKSAPHREIQNWILSTGTERPLPTVALLPSPSAPDLMTVELFRERKTQGNHMSMSE